MAYESVYWRALIGRDLSYIKRKMLLSYRDIEQTIDEEYSKLEIKIMTLAYVARKLGDTGKLPDATLSQPVRVTVYPRTNKTAPAFPDIEGEYDLAQPTSANLQVRKVCNQIIHSHILQLVGSSRRAFKSLLFVSDQDKNKGLYELSIRDFIRMLEQVRTATANQLTAHYDVVKDKWIYTRS